MRIITENKQAILFLLKFLSAYFILNVFYGLYIEHYYPLADPLTRLVSNNTVRFISLFSEGVSIFNNLNSANVGIQLNGKTIINIFEGCNSLNVMIVYASFIIAFTGGLKKTLIFLAGGVAIIYLVNIARVVLLYEVSLYFPDQVYFFHKFLFTAIIYLFVFVLWYFWIEQVRKNERRTS